MVSLVYPQRYPEALEGFIEGNLDLSPSTNHHYELVGAGLVPALGSRHTISRYF